MLRKASFSGPDSMTPPGEGDKYNNNSSPASGKATGGRRGGGGCRSPLEVVVWSLADGELGCANRISTTRNPKR